MSKKKILDKLIGGHSWAKRLTATKQVCPLSAEGGNKIGKRTLHRRDGN